MKNESASKRIKNDSNELPRPTTKKTRTSSAQQVINKAHKRDSAQNNIDNLPATRLERGRNADGHPTLTAIFPVKGGGPSDRIDLSFLLNFPKLADLFAEGCLKSLRCTQLFQSS